LEILAWSEGEAAAGRVSGQALHRNRRGLLRFQYGFDSIWGKDYDLTNSPIIKRYFSAKMPLVSRWMDLKWVEVSTAYSS